MSGKWSCIRIQFNFILRYSSRIFVTELERYQRYCEPKSPLMPGGNNSSNQSSSFKPDTEEAFQKAY